MSLNSTSLNNLAQLNARPLNGLMNGQLNARPLNGLQQNGLMNARPLNGLSQNGQLNARPLNGFGSIPAGPQLNATGGPFTRAAGVVEATSALAEVQTPGGPMFVSGIETDLSQDGLGEGRDAGGLSIAVPNQDGSSTIVSLQTTPPQAPAPEPMCEFPVQQFSMVRDVNVTRTDPRIENVRKDVCGNVLGFNERVEVIITGGDWRVDGGQTNGIVGIRDSPDGPVNGYGNQYGNRGYNPRGVASNANVGAAVKMASTYRG